MNKATRPMHSGELKIYNILRIESIFTAIEQCEQGFIARYKRYPTRVYLNVGLRNAFATECELNGFPIIPHGVNNMRLFWFHAANSTSNSHPAAQFVIVTDETGRDACTL